MRYLAGVVFLSLIAVSASGSLIFDPPRPTDHQLVTARIDEPWPSCQPGALQSVTLSGDDVLVRFSEYGRCECLFTWRTDVSLGTLPPGSHQVKVFVGPMLVSMRRIEVAEGQPELIVTPAVLDSAESTPVVITTRGDTLCGDQGATEVFVDGIAVPATRTLCTVRMTLPPRAAGPVDILVKTEKNVYRTRGTVRYFDRKGAPDPWLYERMLVPLLVNESGAYDSRWVSEASITNVSGEKLLWRYDVASPCDGCYLEPGDHGSLSGFGNHPNGLVLFIPRELAPYVYFGSLVRDTRRAAQFGTEVPVIRESDSYTGIMRLVGVPFEERYRLQLRVYGIDGASVVFKVRVIRDDGFIENPLVLSAPCTEHELPCNSELPAYASVDLRKVFPWEKGQHIVRLEPIGVTNPLHYWAMVSVTDNVTNTVTLLTPQ